ncbi:MAG: UDP-N-acetylmuramoyl-tripeptide--D-alanyl-D-alanine ligase [Clostridia bacterium]|nr:UDP-N-acetylmuramoyl-tripeptide--D-alanyl-D-alanine ligase [Clostridia bacterium]
MKIKLGLGRLTADKVASICGGTLYTVACENKVLFETVCTDSREADNTSMFVAIKGERVDGHSYIPNVVKAGCRCVIAERVPLDVKGIAVILVKDSIRAIRDIAEYVKSQVEIQTVAITGSVGKTTTKEFVSAVLDRKFNLYKTEGNFNSTIGMPMSMLELNHHHNAAVFEMGMSGLGEIEFMSEAAKPDVAIITNIGSSHLEMLGSRENIRRAKMEITTGLRDGGTLFLNGDEPLLQGHESDRYNVVYFGMKNEECDYFASNIRSVEGGIIFDMKTPAGVFENIKINLAGAHNVYNAMVAFTVGLKMEMSEAEIRAGLLSYKAAKMRQNIYNVGGITVIEDCYNASPESMNAAINVLGDTAKLRGGRMIALLGDMRELGTTTAELHAGVGSYLAEKNADYLFTYGELSSENLADGAVKGGMSEKKVFRNPVTDPEAVGKKLLGVLKAGDVLLVKASRGLAAENVLNYVKAQLA